MAKLIEGLIEPNSVPQTDLEHYLSTTYAGYLREAQERLWFCEYMNHSGLAKESHVILQTKSLQLRMCTELLSYALKSFDEAFNGIAGRHKRTMNDPEKIIKDLRDTTLWPQVVDPDAPNINFDDPSEVCLNLTKVTGLKSSKDLIGLEGKLGNILHAKQRPRKDSTGQLAWNEIDDIARRLKLLFDRHVISLGEGHGWYFDSRAEYGPPHSGPNKVIWSLIDSID